MQSSKLDWKACIFTPSHPASLRCSEATAKRVYEMDKDSQSEGLPGPSSVSGAASTDQFVSPATATDASGIAARPLEQWSGSEREEAERKRAKTSLSGSSSTDLHQNVQLCPLQREVLNKVVSTLDTSNSSVVITNPQIKGARRGALAATRKAQLLSSDTRRRIREASSGARRAARGSRGGSAQALGTCLMQFLGWAPRRAWRACALRRRAAQ